VAVWRQTDGELWQSAGKLVRKITCDKFTYWAMYDPTKEADKLAVKSKILHLVDYADGDLDICAECTTGHSYPIWTGRFYPVLGNHINQLYWSALHPSVWNINTDRQLYADSFFTSVRLHPTPPVGSQDVCAFRMSIACSKPNNLCYIWEGYKTLCNCSLDPAGTYKRTPGSTCVDQTAELELETEDP